MRTIDTSLSIALVLLVVFCSNVRACQSSSSSHRPGFDLPVLKDCRPDLPCEYGEGDCGRSGDEGCESGLVCGVSNCGSFEPGLYGSCCADASPSITELEDIPDS